MWDILLYIDIIIITSFFFEMFVMFLALLANWRVEKVSA